MQIVDRPCTEVLLAVRQRDAHPPLYYAALRLWMAASHSGLRARAFSAAASVATLVVFHLLVRVLLEERWALLATGLLAVSSSQVFYAQEARLYALATLFVTAGWYLLVQLIAGKRLERWPLWVGLALQPLLAQLAAQVQAALLLCALPVEERPFSPHLTLARLKFPAAREVGAFLAQPLPTLPAIAVQEFILFESRLTPHGAEHLPLHRFLLPGSP